MRKTERGKGGKSQGLSLVFYLLKPAALSPAKDAMMTFGVKKQAGLGLSHFRQQRSERRMCVFWQKQAICHVNGLAFNPHAREVK